MSVGIACLHCSFMIVKTTTPTGLVYMTFTGFCDYLSYVSTLSLSKQRKAAKQQSGILADNASTFLKVLNGY